MTILIIEDEIKLSDILKKALKAENYATETAFDGEEGLKKAMTNNYALIILDIMLPKKDGMEVCKELRKNHIQTPIIMLTARGLIEDRIQGLNLGADDYLLKPFGIRELQARIRAVLRRRNVAESEILKIGNLVMDTAKHEVTRAGKKIALTPKEYRILDTFVRRPHQAITRRQLVDEVWGPEFNENNNELNVHIRYLRRKIDGKGMKPLIHTLRGVGYTLHE